MFPFEAEVCHVHEKAKGGVGGEGVLNLSPVERPPCLFTSVPFGKSYYRLFWETFKNLFTNLSEISKICPN